MTFTEAAIEVLRREGKPLHFKKIAEIAIRESLLDHVGKVPDDTMADQLVAHCRLPHEDRKVIPILSGTFALVEWGMDEDPTALENLLEIPPEGELPYRGKERHPIPLRELGRGEPGRGGRGERRRREEEGPRQRRFPPPAEVAYEILAGAGNPLALTEIAAQGAERLLMPDAFVRDAGALRAALEEDNRRRESSGRRALFQVDGETVTLIAQPEPGEKPTLSAVRGPVTAVDARRSGLSALRRRLRECDPPTVEHVVCRMLEKMGFKEIKVAKRGREHVIYTARRRLGLADVRHGIRILRTSADVTRRDVSELRRDLGHYGAQIGAVVSAGEAAREARGEAGAPGQLPVLLLCGEAMAEAFADAGVGCVQVVVPEVDEAFFRTAAEAAETEEAARRARREERDRREGREGREDRRRDERREERSSQPRDEEAADDEADTAEAEAPDAGRERPRVVEVPATLPGEVSADAADGEPEGDDDGDDAEGGPEEAAAGESGAESGAGAEAGQGGERRRRRRRRRRRGGRGRSREGGGEREPGAAGGEASAQGAPGEPPSPAPAGSSGSQE